MSTTEQHHTAAPAPTPGTAPAAGPSHPDAPAPVLASDAEREAVVARLHEALGEGRLDLVETDARVAAAYAARHRGDLPPLLSDLPGPQTSAWSLPSPSPGSAAPTWAALWTSVVWRARVTLLGVEVGGTPPTPASCRRAAVLAAVVVAFLLLCAFLGAALAGA